MNTSLPLSSRSVNTFPHLQYRFFKNFGVLYCTHPVFSDASAATNELGIPINGFAAICGNHVIVENWSDLLAFLPLLSHFDLKESELRKWSSTYAELFAAIFSLLTFLSSGIIKPSTKVFSVVDNEGAVSLMKYHSLIISLFSFFH